MSKYLNPKIDLTFKKVFGLHSNLVMSLLNALLPLPEGMKIMSVEYITNETVPENPARKNAIVDVRCKDNYGRGFIVEMQNYWNREFFSRTLYNATAMYSQQLAMGNPFDNLKDVYALAIVNDKAFDYEGDNGYIQEFYITNKNHPDDRRHDLSLIFVELKKYKPVDKGSRALKDLWLKFLTEIDETTQSVEEDMLANPDIKQALEIVERSAMTEAELYAYNDCILNLKGQHDSIVEATDKGRAEGRAEGLAEGRAEGLVEGAKQQAIATARSAKSMGLPIDQIVLLTNLTPDEIIAL